MHLRQCGVDENQIDQDELFDCHVNSGFRCCHRWFRHHPSPVSL
ncbi:hypothetical protein [Halomonas cupida]